MSDTAMHGGTGGTWSDCLAEMGREIDGTEPAWFVVCTRCFEQGHVRDACPNPECAHCGRTESPWHGDGWTLHEFEEAGR
jgi:hypothetical protein